MKTKSFILPLLALFCLVLTGCNDDATKNDSALSGEIIGSWLLEFESDNTSNSVTYKFDAKEFSYTTSTLKTDDFVLKTMSVHGTWRIYKGVLELTYNLNTFSTTGYSDEESHSIYTGFVNNNKLVDDLKNSGQPYGPEITFAKSGNKDTMKLSFVNGTFVRASY